MVITIENIKPELDKIIKKMKHDSLQFGLVAHCGYKTEPLGKHIAESFHCETVRLDSLQRSKIHPRLSIILNKIYKYFPTRLLYSLSLKYQDIYLSNTQHLPSTQCIPFAITTYSKQLPILIIDDTVFTGNTLEAWKHKIQSLNPHLNIITCSLTVTGTYIPNYYYLKEWRPFEWKQIGM
jgi:hypothetical protein